MVFGERPRSRAPLHGGAFVVCALVAIGANAFERAKSEHSAPWRWTKPALTVDAGDVRASGLPPALVRAALERAAATWTAAGCGVSLAPARGPGADIEVRFVAQLDQKKAADTAREGDAHKGVLSRATVTLSAAYPWGAQAPLPEGALDLETLLVHELGHALGLAHSFDRRAIMRAGARPLRIKRALADDDRRGLCSIYPPP
jgi:hypothetical protein